MVLNLTSGIECCGARLREAKSLDELLEAVKREHEDIRFMLRRLKAICRSIEDGHIGIHDAQRIGVEVQKILTAMVEHAKAEEEIVIPLLRSAGFSEPEIEKLSSLHANMISIYASVEHVLHRIKTGLTRSPVYSLLILHDIAQSILSRELLEQEHMYHEERMLYEAISRLKAKQYA